MGKQDNKKTYFSCYKRRILKSHLTGIHRFVHAWGSFLQIYIRDKSFSNKVLILHTYYSHWKHKSEFFHFPLYIYINLFAQCLLNINLNLR